MGSWLILSMGKPACLGRAVAAHCTHGALQFRPDCAAGQDLFDVLVRQVDRIDAGNQMKSAIPNFQQRRSSSFV